MMTIDELLKYKTDKELSHTENMGFFDSVTQIGALSARMRKFFLKNPVYNQNWMAVVVNAVTSKLAVEGIQVQEQNEGDTARGDFISQYWDSHNMAALSDLVHEYTHVTGEGFVILDDDGKPYVQDPRSVVVVYDGVDPLQITQAAKFYVAGKRHFAQVWEYDENGRVITQHFEGTTTTSRTETGVAANQGMSYRAIGEAETTKFPRIPVFHFRRSLRNIESEFYQVLDIQKSINYSNTALGYSSEYAANQVRVAITHQDMGDAADQMAPGGMLQLEPAAPGEQPVSIQAIKGEDMRQFLDYIDRQIDYISAITFTPRFYFRDLGGGVSGEALQAWESPLNTKVRKYQRLHATQWESLLSVVFALSGMAVKESEITCHYASPETLLSISQSTARMNNKTAGIPILTQLRMEGWREDELNMMIADRNVEATPEMDQTALEQVYDRVSEQNARLVEPVLKEVLERISTAAIQTIAQSGVVERLAGTSQ
jgi:hypothetical protein